MLKNDKAILAKQADEFVLAVQVNTFALAVWCNKPASAQRRAQSHRRHLRYLQVGSLSAEKYGVLTKFFFLSSRARGCMTPEGKKKKTGRGRTV